MEMGEKCLNLHIFSQHCCKWGGYGGSISERPRVSKSVVLALNTLNGTSIQPPPPPPSHRTLSSISSQIDSCGFAFLSMPGSNCILSYKQTTLILEEYEKRKADGDSHSLLSLQKWAVKRFRPPSKPATSTLSKLL